MRMSFYWVNFGLPKVVGVLLPGYPRHRPNAASRQDAVDISRPNPHDDHPGARLRRNGTLFDEPEDVFRTETRFRRVDGRPARVAILNYLVRDAFDRALYIEGLVLDTSALHTERSLSIA